MHVFRDAAGREWSVTLTVSSLARVRDRAGFDIGGRDFQQVLGRLADQVLFARVLWALLEPQATKPGVSEDQFLESLNGDALEAAYTAFVEAYIDFFPSGQRQGLRDLLTLSEKIRAEALRQTQEEMAGTDATAEATKLIQSVRNGASGKSSLSLPASSGLTPDLTPSAS